MDDYLSQPELTGLDKDVLEQGFQYLTKKATDIVVVSKKLHDDFESRGIDSIVIENGFDATRFSYPSPDESQIRSRYLLPKENFALYVGGINARIDLDYLHGIAQTGAPLVIAGAIDPQCDEKTKRNYDALITYENVYNLGSVPHDDIPAIMTAATVGIVPYADGPFNRASFPLKIPEYLGSGLQVVSTNLDFVSMFEPQDVRGSFTVDEFVSDVTYRLNSPRTPGQRAMQSSRIAQVFSWDSRAEKYLEIISS
jgi:teichuronic acid biosynthesis glycosyltransferase TuaH